MRCLQDPELDPLGFKVDPASREFAGSSKMLWSNSPESIDQNVLAKPVLAMADVSLGEFLVACHHKNATDSRQYLRVVIKNESPTNYAYVTVHQNAHGYFEVGPPGTGHGVAIAGRDAAFKFFANINRTVNGFPPPWTVPIAPNGALVIWLGKEDLFSPFPYLEGQPGLHGVATAMVRCVAFAPVKVFVVAGMGGDFDLADPKYWSKRTVTDPNTGETRPRGSLPDYRIINDYRQADESDIVEIRVPNDFARRKYLILLDDSVAAWKTLNDEMAGALGQSPNVEFRGEYHVVQEILFRARNFEPNNSFDVGVIVNPRGGDLGGAALVEAGPVVYAIAPACENPDPDPCKHNLGILRIPPPECKDADNNPIPRQGMNLLPFPAGCGSTPPCTHELSFKYILGGGGNAPVAFVAVPCSPLIAPPE
ncbi:MAG: hypothetical protein IH851_01050 [Armatimonadetes bacterium]|nr:hypothetical protein [Armatimonadota bacterium]